MKHIIDTEQIMKLPRYDHETAGEWAGMVENNDGDYIRIDDLRAIIANSPQADGMVLVPSEPTKEMVIEWHKAHEKGQWNASSWDSTFSLAYKAMLSAYKPQDKARE